MDVRNLMLHEESRICAVGETLSLFATVPGGARKTDTFGKDLRSTAQVELFAMMFRGQKWTTDRILARMNGRRIKSLELYDTQADDDLLIALAEVGSLTSLDVSSAVITDSGVRALVEKCGLKTLVFREAPLVTDSSLKDISACMTLRELYLEGTAVTDDAIGLINALPDLWSLDVSRTQITDTGISRIASTHINLISFNDSALTGIGFSTWSVTDKMSFYTKQSSLNDEGFAVACKAFTFMWNVVIEYTEVTSLGLTALEGQSPTSIRVNGSKIDREGLVWLIENTEIQGIEADSTQFSAADVERYRDYNGRCLRIVVCE